MQFKFSIHNDHWPFTNILSLYIHSWVISIFEIIFQELKKATWELGKIQMSDW
jgi:hypothetical protein